jgi:hypothetical protein
MFTASIIGMSVSGVGSGLGGRSLCIKKYKPLLHRSINGYYCGASHWPSFSGIDPGKSYLHLLFQRDFIPL